MFPQKSAAKYALVVMGSAVLAFGLFNVHAQSNITEGGVLGAMLLIEHWTGLSPSISGTVLDILCYLIGFKVLGTGFAKYSLVSTLSFAAIYRVLEHFGPTLPSFSQSPLLAAILGGLFVGLGCGLVVRIGGAAGGDDALAMSVSHVTKWPIARVYLITDAVILLASLTYLPAKQIGFSLISVCLSSYIIGAVQKIGTGKAPAAAAPAGKAAAPKVEKL